MPVVSFRGLEWGFAVEDEIWDHNTLAMRKLVFPTLEFAASKVPALQKEIPELESVKPCQMEEIMAFEGASAEDMNVQFIHHPCIMYLRVNRSKKLSDDAVIRIWWTQVNKKLMSENLRTCAIEVDFDDVCIDFWGSVHEAEEMLAGENVMNKKAKKV